MGSRCNLICCPNCGYQVVDESKSWLAGLLRRLWPPSNGGETPRRERRAERTAEPVVPLTHIPVGMEVEVRRLEGMPPTRMTRLSAFGLVPGGRVQVLQRHPAPVIRIGETELALSEEILEQIWVRVGHATHGR
jgi:Fe2+ transport system protein FeoA